MNKILPCPFCGSEAKLKQGKAIGMPDSRTVTAFVQCESWKCEAKGPEKDSFEHYNFGESECSYNFRKEVIESWNKRIDQLLIKYIKYIIDVEGTDYIEPHDRRYQSDVKFSSEEWSTLLKISKMKS